MALTVQLWTPVVCGCTIHEVFDPDDETVDKTYVTLDEAKEVLNKRGIDSDRIPPAKLCKSHQSLGHTTAMYDALRYDNDIVLNDTIHKVLLPNIAGLEEEQIAYTLDADRVLQVTLSEITLNPLKRTQLDADLVVKFGLGKVSIA